MRQWLADFWRSRGLSRPVAIIYVVLALLFALAVSQFYIPGKGFTSLIAFGDQQESVRLSKVRRVDYYVERFSSGYDAQFYAQIAMDPSLKNQGLPRAVDSLPYRARRILFCATAYLFGLGDPARILQVFALQNAVSWLLLGVLILHWFPPTGWSNLLRWSGVMFSLGVCASVRNALMDGPSLLLIALGVFLLEKKRPWASTAVLALSGLGKETNLLGGSILLPETRTNWKGWGLAVLRGVLVAAPLLLWLVYITYQVGPVTDVGRRNFDLPFLAYVAKWREVAADWAGLRMEFFAPVYGVLIMISLTVQFLFLVLRPQWTKAWWRIGVCFALLMVFLGGAVWEGFPGAASRVLLPMQLAFNVLVPNGRKWLAVLLAGNLTLVSAPYMLQSPPSEGYMIAGNTSLRTSETGRIVRVDFSPEWYGAEQSGANYWCWSPGSASVIVQNPHPVPLQARLRFSLTAKGSRAIWVRVNGAEAWRASLSDEDTVAVSLARVSLAPGANRIEFVTDVPPVAVQYDERLFSFSLTDFRIDLQELQPARAGIPPAR